MMHLPIALSKSLNNTCDKLKLEMSSTLWVRELSNPSLFISCKFFNLITLCNYYNKYFWKGNVSTSYEKLAKTFKETIYFKGRNFCGQKLSRFSRIFDIFTKVYYLHTVRCELSKVFSRDIPIK